MSRTQRGFLASLDVPRPTRTSVVYLQTGRDGSVSPTTQYLGVYWEAPVHSSFLPTTPDYLPQTPYPSWSLPSDRPAPDPSSPIRKCKRKRGK